jgi:hypothetical protein
LFSCEYVNEQSFLLEPFANIPLPPIRVVPNGLEPFVMQVAVAIRNITIDKSKGNNAARIFCLNQLSHNKWMNNDYAEVISEVLCFISLEMKKGMYRMVEQAIQPVIETYLCYYVSNLTILHPRIKNFLSPEQCSAAVQNISNFNQLKSDINMNFPQAGYFQGNQPVATQYPYGGQMPMMQAPYQPQPPQPMIAVSDGRGGVMYVPAQYLQAPQQYPDVRQDAVQHRFTGTPVPTQQTQQSHTPEPPKQAQTNTFDFRLSQPEPKSQQIPLAGEVKPAFLELLQGSESAKTINFLFGNCHQDILTYRLDDYRAAVAELSVSTIHDPESVVYDGIITSCSLEEMILLGRNEKNKLQKKATYSKVFRIFGRELDLLGSSSDAADMTARLYKEGDTTGIIHYLKTMNELVKTTQAKSSMQNKIETTVLLTLMSSIDYRVTRIINDYLKNRLGCESISISSFVEDGQDLPKYLGDHFGQSYLVALNAFYEIIFDCYLANVAQDEYVEIMNAQNMEDQVCEILAKNVSLTFLPLTSVELGFNIQQGEKKIISVNTPVLLECVSSLNNHKRSVFETISDYLITADGVIYEYFEDSLKANTWYIRQR